MNSISWLSSTVFAPAFIFPIAIALIVIVGAIMWQKRSNGGNGGSQKKILSQYITNLSERARNGSLDPVIGRQHEVDQLIRVLSRKTKHNAMLLGEPGVGKTAVVERLAQLINQKHVPEQLLNKDIIVLDLASLVANTKYRGELESRLDKVRIELREQADHVILFIDEIHQLAEASGAEGGLNPADILKPELARGTIQVIGATTYEEYKKYILPDESLERRFHPIHVHEATREEALSILQGIRPVFEKFHTVTYSDEALEQIVDLSTKYVKQRFLPDKAIDVLDEAGVRTRIKSLKDPAANNVSAVEIKEVISEWIDTPIANLV